MTVPPPDRLRRLQYNPSTFTTLLLYSTLPGFSDFKTKHQTRSVGSLEKKHRKLATVIIFLGEIWGFFRIFHLKNVLTVTEVFNVEPPQLDLDYLETDITPIVKKTGDIFDDVKFFRRSFR